MKKNIQIKKIISNMTVEQKVGQCLVIGFCGTVVTPKILHRIRNYYPSGIRAGLTFRCKTAYHDPYATSSKFADRVLRYPTGQDKDFIKDSEVPYCSNMQYCDFLNTLKYTAINNSLGLPLHITMDMEGGVSCDYPRGGVSIFPMPMGLAKSLSRQNAYNAAWATGRQLTSLGVNWIHSPVLDVNSEPLNPEISDRAYGETSGEVIEYASASYEGFKSAGIITTGKHFPGRGASKEDAHTGLPYIDLSMKDISEHIKPFRKLINAGLPSIMSAHTVYTAFDSSEPSTLSYTILTKFLRDELGFEGVVTTDDITMGGIVQKYEVHEACIRALMAGADLVLIRDESSLVDEVFKKLVKAVEKGHLSEERLEQAIARTLKIKYDYGLFDNDNIRDVSKADEGFLDNKVSNIAKQTARDCIKVLRDENNILPLKSADRVLLIEQRNPLHVRINTQECHPCIFWELLSAYSDNVGVIETEMVYTDNDRDRIQRRIEEADIIIITNYYDRRVGEGNTNRFIESLQAKGKTVIVLTNSHYPMTVSDSFKTVICTYGVSSQSLSEASKIIYDDSSGSVQLTV